MPLRPPESFNDPPMPQGNGQPPGPQLVSTDDVEEAVASMLRISKSWGESSTASPRIIGRS